MRRGCVVEIAFGVAARMALTIVGHPLVAEAGPLATAGIATRVARLSSSSEQDE
jgi:hypothetical protein